MEQASGKPIQAPALPRMMALAYAAPVAPMWTLHAPALAVLPALYAKHSAVSVAMIGVILTVTRLFDVVTDPLIGYVSDRIRSPWGRRKPMMVVGATLATIGAFFWLRPSPEVGALWFLLSSIVVYLGWTLVEVPHAAWLSELTSDYGDRSRISAYRTGAYYFGYLLFVSAPLWPIFPTTEMTPDVTAVISWVLVVAIPLTVGAAVIRVPQAMDAQPQPSTAGPREMMAAFLRNRPFWLLSGSFVVSGLSTGMVGALYFFFIDAYLGILDKIAHVGLIVAGISFITVPIWPAILKRLDKHRTLALCAISTALTLVAMGFIRPGPLAFPLLAAIFGCSALLSSGIQVCLMSMMADVVDYDELKTGKNNAAAYFSFTALYQKLGMALGGGLAFIIVGLFGFDPGGENSNTAMTGFFLTFLVIPILLNSLAAVLAWIYPLNRRRHKIIERKLKRRRAGG